MDTWGQAQGMGAAYWGPTQGLSDRRAPVSPRKKGVMNGGQRSQMGPSSTPRTQVPGHQGPSKDTKVKLLLFKYKKIS